MLSLIKPLDDKILLLGMSCVGKTHFAKLLETHKYICFDALFPWNALETLGGSIKKNLLLIRPNDKKYVIDGWHNSDLQCKSAPNAIPYILYADYSFILSNYRVDITGPQAFFNMYEKWYKGSFPKNARYIKNIGSFEETTKEEFTEFVNKQKQKIDKIWNKEKWTWN